MSLLFPFVTTLAVGLAPAQPNPQLADTLAPAVTTGAPVDRTASEAASAAPQVSAPGALAPAHTAAPARGPAPSGAVSLSAADRAQPRPVSQAVPPLSALPVTPGSTGTAPTASAVDHQAAAMPQAEPGPSPERGGAPVKPTTSDTADRPAPSALPAAPRVAAAPGAATPPQAPLSAAGEAAPRSEDKVLLTFGQPVQSSALADQRGGADVHNDMYLSGVVAGNSATNVVTGANTIDSGAFANMNGVPMVVQNSGANVLIQNATIVSVQVQ